MREPIKEFAEGWRFGPYRLLPQRKQLLLDGAPCLVGDRAFDLLVTLVSRGGEVVTKRELIQAAWPGMVVEESNLRVQIGALRKLLDPAAPDRYIRNVTGRGYCFVAAAFPLSPIDEPASPSPSSRFTPHAAEAAVPARASHLPLLLQRLIGREGSMRQLADTVGARRLVSVVGPGGIGKTTIALGVAHELAGLFADQIYLVPLAPLGDEQLVAATFCSTLGIPVLADDALPQLIDHLRTRRLLLVLDNCEHVVDAAAAVVEAVLRSAPQVHIMATSREPLRAEGEWVIRLPGLDVPPQQEGLTAAALRRFSSVELFLERAQAHADTLQLADEDALHVAEICRRLDGIPLAIELAAARVDQLGLAELQARLDDRFAVLTKGRRTALPRHQTLRAALDWSFDLLDERQRSVLVDLSVFRSHFSVEAAVSVVAGRGFSAGEVAETVPSLAAKSLLATSRVQGQVVYHLLETTRLYASEQLARHPMQDKLREQHARHLVQQFGYAEAEWPLEPAADWLARYSDRLDDLRAALSWCLGSGARHALGRTLLIASSALWVRLALMKELRSLTETALRCDLAPADWDASTEMHLENLLGMAVWQTRLDPEMGAAFRRALSIAEQLGDHEAQVDALRGIFVERSSIGDYQGAADIWRRIVAIHAETRNPIHDLLRQTLHALTLHWLGDQATAWACAESLLDHPAIDARRDRTGTICGHGIAARWAHARIAWVAGYPDRAVVSTHALLDAAQQQDDPSSLFLALAGGACHVSVWSGDRELSQRCLDLLRRYSRHYPLDYWNSWLRSYEMALDIDPLSHSTVGSEFPIAQIESQFGPTQLESIATMNPKLVGPWISKRVREAPGIWCVPEIMRVEAERMSVQGLAMEAFERLSHALELSQRQSARAWELRIATSLARWHQRHGEARAGLQALESAYSKFSEGHARPDAIAARRLLQSLKGGL